MLQAKNFFYCYSKNLFLFLKSRGIEYIHTAYHISSNNQFWVYEKTDELQVELAEYREMMNKAS